MARPVRRAVGGVPRGTRRRSSATELTQRLRRHVVPPRRPLRWVHPTVGELRLDREVLELPADDAQQVVVLLPADDATADALDRLRRTSSGTLRAVR